MLCSCDRLLHHPSNTSSGEKDENSFFRIFLPHVLVGAASLDRIKAKQLEVNAEPERDGQFGSVLQNKSCLYTIAKR